MQPTPFQVAAVAIFALALGHVFLAGRIARFAHRV